MSSYNQNGVRIKNKLLWTTYTQISNIKTFRLIYKVGVQLTTKNGPGAFKIGVDQYHNTVYYPERFDTNTLYNRKMENQL